MSALSGVSSSASVSYATQLAQTSAFKRSLYNLDQAVQNGNLTSAGSILTALMKANPQYASASADSTQSQDPINQDFQNLANAISNNDADAAKSAWAQLKSDLAQAGVTEISSGTELAAKAVAQNKAFIEQTLLGSLFSAAPDGSSSIASLIGGSSSSSTGTDPVSALVSNWLEYKANGTASSSTIPGTTENSLDAAV